MLARSAFIMGIKSNMLGHVRTSKCVSSLVNVCVIMCVLGKKCPPPVHRRCSKDRHAACLFCDSERSPASHWRKVGCKGTTQEDMPAREYCLNCWTRRLFGSDEDRIKEVNGVAIESEDWGGSTLDDHHSFIVQYRPSDDK